MKYLMPLALIALSGCASPERKAPYTTENIPIAEAGGFECDASAAQYAVGQKTSVALAQQLMAKARASVLRWMPPRSAVTMDYSPMRLNISYDDAMVIDRITCG
jgi:hypothetical protein